MSLPDAFSLKAGEFIMRKPISFIACLAFCVCAGGFSVFGQQTARYSILMLGKPAGTQTSIVRPDGVREFAFEYTDGVHERKFVRQRDRQIAPAYHGHR